MVISKPTLLGRIRVYSIDCIISRFSGTKGGNKTHLHRLTADRYADSTYGIRLVKKASTGKRREEPQHGKKLEHKKQLLAADVVIVTCTLRPTSSLAVTHPRTM